VAAPRQQQESIRLFQNPILEALTHVHPLLPLLMWGPVVAALVWISLSDGLNVTSVAGLAVMGVFVWTAVEYFLHRFVFHFRPSAPWQERIAYLIHGIHHDQPQDATRLVMPPAAALILATILYLSFRLVLGVQLVMPFFAGFIAGYLCYDYIHYAIHHFMPRNAALKYLKNHHMKHHYMMHGARWGVSSPLWDVICGTMEERVPPVGGVNRGA
jgi:sterol desaturase/sphingolipid hydroxylase (fatty acid hydroxylase superfamily)